MFSKLFKRSKSNDPAFKEGKLAFSNGIDISQNPYQNSSKHLAISWENGWKEAQKARKVLEKKHTWPQSPALPNNHNQPSYASLDSHVQRFIEISEALGEIGTIFESVDTKTASGSSESDPLEQISQSVNKVRIPGFFAYHLAQEALSLLNVIAASAALAKKDIEASERLKAALSKIEESEPTLRQTVYEMEPYKSMNANEAIQIIAARITEKKEI
jgi:hypothetical protein